MKTGSFPYRRGGGIEIETIEELHNYFSSMEVKIARTRVYMGRDKIEGDFLLVIGIFGETMGERGLAINSYIRAWLQITRAREREKLILINEGNRGGIVGEGSRRRRKCAAHANSPPLPPRSQSQCPPTLRIYILTLPSSSSFSFSLGQSRAFCPARNVHQLFVRRARVNRRVK